MKQILVDSKNRVTVHVDKIKQAYKKLSLTHHPDAGGDREKWERLSKAYQEALKLVNV